MAAQPQNVYRVIEKILRASPEPMTCIQLFDKPEVRKLAPDTAKVSDVLGNLWRREYLVRFAAPPGRLGDQTKWAYAWKNQSEMVGKEIPLVKAEEKDNDLVIELPGYRIIVQKKAA
jgi:hypothetical protein